MEAAIIARDRIRKKNRNQTMLDNSGLLKNYWYAAGRSADVGGKRPVGCIILGEMLVLWRDKDEQVVAMSDRCLHRNAPLSKGDLFDGCIGCPYHGWTYDRDGRCVNVPSEGPDGASVDLGLTTFPVLERDGLVWVWMGRDNPPDKEPFSMPYWDAPGWGAYYMVTRFQNGVTALVENFMDVPHTVFVHKGWFRSRSRQETKMSVERTENSVLVTYDQPQDQIGFTGRILNPKNHPMVHTDKFYMPNVTRVDYTFGEDGNAFVITSTCTPISEYETMVYTLISYRLGPFNALGRVLLPFYTRQVIEQDVRIMAKQGRVLRHHDGRSYTSTPADTLHVFIESLRDWEASGGKGPRPRPETQTVSFWT